MEKREIKVDYNRSGVNTLSGFGTVFFVIGIIAILLSIVGFSIYISEVDSLYGEEEAVVGLIFGSMSVSVAFVSFIGGAICMGLSSIVRTVLYQRMILEEKYYFINK